MVSNANSVNINADERSYHHGGLREAALAEGLRLLESCDADALSLRQIARNVGVSATALYRHFPDKNSLPSALAGIGFAQLAEELSRAGLRGGAEGFAASGQAYVRFAVARPSLFRLMFAKMPAESHPEFDNPPGSAAHLLQRGIRGMMPPGSTPHDHYAAMLRAWSLVHGLAMLILDRQVDEQAAVAMIDRIVSADSINVG
jgi:AcrR family transcriptional regulator